MREEEWGNVCVRVRTCVCSSSSSSSNCRAVGSVCRECDGSAAPWGRAAAPALHRRPNSTLSLSATAACLLLQVERKSSPFPWPAPWPRPSRPACHTPPYVTYHTGINYHKINASPYLSTTARNLWYTTGRQERILYFTATFQLSDSCSGKCLNILTVTGVYWERSTNQKYETEFQFSLFLFKSRASSHSEGVLISWI